jgi:hypothetical protein
MAPLQGSEGQTLGCINASARLRRLRPKRRQPNRFPPDGPHAVTLPARGSGKRHGTFYIGAQPRPLRRWRRLGRCRSPPGGAEQWVSARPRQSRGIVVRTAAGVAVRTGRAAARWPNSSGLDHVRRAPSTAKSAAALRGRLSGDAPCGGRRPRGSWFEARTLGWRQRYARSRREDCETASMHNSALLLPDRPWLA